LQENEESKKHRKGKPKTKNPKNTVISKEKAPEASETSVASSHTPMRNATPNISKKQQPREKGAAIENTKNDSTASVKETGVREAVKSGDGKQGQKAKTGVAIPPEIEAQIIGKSKVKSTVSKKTFSEGADLKSKVKKSTYGQTKFEREAKKLEEQNKDAPLIFFGDKCCTDATEFATLIGKARVNEFLTNDYLAQKILMELYNNPEGISKSDVARKLGVDKSTIVRRMAKKQIKPLISVERMGAFHRVTLSYKGKSFMKYVLQVLTGYETHDVSATRKAILARPHKLTYKAEIHRFPKNLLPDKTQKGTYFVSGWKVWEVKNNYRFQREFPIRMSMDSSEYVETVLLDFMYKTDREAYVYIHLPEIFAETFDMAKRQVADINLRVLDTLRTEGFMFKAGDYYSATIKKTDGEYAIVNHPLARLGKAMGYATVETDRIKIDSSKQIPELEGYSEVGEDIMEFEMDRLQLQSTFVEDEEGNRQRIHDPIRTQAMAYETETKLGKYNYEMEEYLKIVKESYKEMAKSVADGFQEVQNKMRFNLGGLPLNQQAKLIESSLDIIQKNEELERRIKILEKKAERE
jgi:hypothetical protein